MEQPQAADSHELRDPLPVMNPPWNVLLVQYVQVTAMKKLALTLELVKAKVLALQGMLSTREQELQSVKERKEMLDQERSRLLASLRAVNEAHEHAEVEERTLSADVHALQHQIQFLTSGELPIAQAKLDALRVELGEHDPAAQPPNRQSQIEVSSSLTPPSTHDGTLADTLEDSAQPAADPPPVPVAVPPRAGEPRRGRGRPRGSKGKPKKSEAE
ncbi:hypothetical protein EXIGLDRAFT_439436 [Exidia glandulosa HHB12029]|uniref:Uncharacterized protein n=1 Tax=Exidia glandulosa HHB12029 TaxID=1314781 RepID=A0A165KER1_EXIGL|nr:hypothetical protein EXIGLDRAFT_439436 [Exidia glandulosa HHB12029]